MQKFLYGEGRFNQWLGGHTMHSIMQPIVGAAFGDYPIIFLGIIALLALCPYPRVVLSLIPVLVVLNIALVVINHEFRMTWHEFETQKLSWCLIVVFLAIAIGMILRVTAGGVAWMRRLEARERAPQ